MSELHGATGCVVAYMQTHPFITSKIAYDEYGVTRLAAIIFNLRSKGYNIKTVNVSGVTRFGWHTKYARYVLEE